LRRNKEALKITLRPDNDDRTKLNPPPLLSRNDLTLIDWIGTRSL
jgi:hypothetical protein